MGADEKLVKGAEEGDIESLEVEEKVREMLRLAVKLTLHAYMVEDEDIDRLRAAGWSDEEILEGVWVACNFNFVDRLADTLGLYRLGELVEPSTAG